MTRFVRCGALGTTCALFWLSGLALLQCGGDQKSTAAPPSMPSAEPPSMEEADAATTRPTSPTADSLATERDTVEPKALPVSSESGQAAPLNDEQIAAISEAANTAEIEQAKVAQAKSKDASVKRFAAMMISHHGEAKQRQAKLGFKSKESGVSTALQADAANTMNRLKTEQGKDFDKAYIAAQIAGHQKVLDTIEDQLPHVKNEQLKAYLEEIKPRVALHLKQAKQLQQDADSMQAHIAT